MLPSPDGALTDAQKASRGLHGKPRCSTPRAELHAVHPRLGNPAHAIIVYRTTGFVNTVLADPPTEQRKQCSGEFTHAAQIIRGHNRAKYPLLTRVQILRIMSMGQGRRLVWHLRVPSAGGLGSTSRFFCKELAGQGHTMGVHDSLAANLDLIFNLYILMWVVAYGLVFIGGPIILYRRMVRDSPIPSEPPSRPESSSRP